MTIRDFNFKRGDLVLIRNTAIEKALNHKMRARYLGPLVVLARNKGGAYIICELNGSVFDRPVAAFRVIPYFTRKSLPLPDLNKFIDMLTKRLRSMEESTTMRKIWVQAMTIAQTTRTLRPPMTTPISSSTGAPPHD